MLTIFSTPKAFEGHNKVIQINAITSWTKLKPACEIILLGYDAGTAEMAAELGIRHIPDIERSDKGTPIVSSIFRKAEEAAANDRLCYVNADIILLSDFPRAIQSIPKVNSLAIGRRWDLDLRELVDFSDPDWESTVRTSLSEKGQLHARTGMDYFVFPRGFYRDIPDFYLGRSAWDNWLVYHALYIGANVIDITDVTTVIHQNHDYAHVKGEKQGAFMGPEALHNHKLIGGWEYSLGIHHATKRLTPKGLAKKRSFKDRLNQLDALPVLNDNFKFLGFFRRLRHSLVLLAGSVYHKIFG